MPLSIERTKTILDDCLSRYLQQLLAPQQQNSTPENYSGKYLDVAQDENLSQSPTQSSGYLSEPRPLVDPRGRSSSTSSKPVKTEGVSGVPNYSKPNLTPSYAHGERKGSEMRSRDAQNAPRRDRSPRNAARSNGPEARGPTSRPYIFRSLEEYIITSFKGCDCLNSSFTTAQPAPRNAGNSSPPKQKAEPSSAQAPSQVTFEPDPKLLLLGDIAENSSWWMNEVEQISSSHRSRSRERREKTSSSSRPVSSRSPRINWAELAQWHHMIMTAGTSWVELWSTMEPTEMKKEEDAVIAQKWNATDLAMVDREITESRLHLHRTLLKATENLLKRPRRPLKRPEDTRFLLMLLTNPLIYSSSSSFASYSLAPSAARGDRRPSHPKDGTPRPAPRNPKPPPKPRSNGPGHHYGIVKRILGLLANLPNDCHHYLVSWFSRFSAGQFEKIVDLVGGFVTHRLMRQHGRKRSESAQHDDDLVPSFSSAAGHTPAELHAAINGRSPNKANEQRDQPVVYTDDWQVRAAARVMSLLFTANNANVSRKPDGVLGQDAGSVARNQASRRGHMIPISSFYNTLLDYSDLVADFEAWESKTTKFSFCQYPFFLSIWAKIHILEHDARRQMEVKAREAFFNSIMSRTAISQYLVLKVRRDCLVEDSLRGVSEVVGSSQEEIKKGLRIEFLGEEGVDAGGLRKEWFLLLVREVFDPHHGK